MLIPRIQPPRVVLHGRDQEPAHNRAAAVLGPDDVVGLVVVEARGGADFAVGGVGGGDEVFVVVHSVDGTGSGFERTKGEGAEVSQWAEEHEQGGDGAGGGGCGVNGLLVLLFVLVGGW